jgi:hypothetical protein
VKRFAGTFTWDSLLCNGGVGGVEVSSERRY